MARSLNDHLITAGLCAQLLATLNAAMADADDRELRNLISAASILAMQVRDMNYRDCRDHHGQLQAGVIYYPAQAIPS